MSEFLRERRILEAAIGTDPERMEAWDFLKRHPLILTSLKKRPIPEKIPVGGMFPDGHLVVILSDAEGAEPKVIEPALTDDVINLDPPTALGAVLDMVRVCAATEGIPCDDHSVRYFDPRSDDPVYLFLSNDQLPLADLLSSFIPLSKGRVLSEIATNHFYADPFTTQ